ncbi:MAG TPA: alpha/beta hydrolase, partial [Caballeronia sp.]|nr:alpha/beta hydrolase [Caballeronia sp.]
VIGEAGNDPKVKRLVYVDAFAPDAGESAGTLFSNFKSAPLRAELRPDTEGFLKLTRKGVFSLFAQDLNEGEKAVIYATQGPINGTALGGTLTNAAWRSRPTFYLIGDQDHAIPRAEQERMAARMDATIGHVDSSHVPMLSQPQAVASFILKAAS